LQKSDFVCVLFGAENPFLLRKVDHDKEFYELVGALFIYDLSHGEAITVMREQPDTAIRRRFSFGLTALHDLGPTILAIHFIPMPTCITP
jgi:hypothetical protein